jgi:ribosomal protein L40E
MPTYYHLLDLETDAKTTEIEDAIDEQYHKWRRLVTHHDPDVVTQANQALQRLEKIRATLTDSQSRAIYDEGVGLNGDVGGLGDPDALVANAAPHSPPASPRAKVRDKEPRVDVWTCSKCHTSNPVGTRYCVSCGYEVGVECPKCSHINPATATYCSQCGVNIQEEIQNQQRQRDLEKIQQIEARIRAKKSSIEGLERMSRRIIHPTWSKDSTTYQSFAKQSKFAWFMYNVLAVLVWVGYVVLVIALENFLISSAAFLIGLFVLVGSFHIVLVRPRIDRSIQEHRNTIADLNRQLKSIRAGKSNL